MTTEPHEIPGTMRAVVLDAPGPPEALVIRELPVPRPEDGWVLIEVKAAAESALATEVAIGQNRSRKSAQCARRFGRQN